MLIRYFRYTDEIQKNIEEKKLKDQLVFKNQAEGRAAYEGAQLSKMIQEGQATVDVKLQEGRAYVTKKEADRDLYVRTKHAEGDLLVKLAEARKTQLRNDAFQGAGSDRMVGLKMAEVYKGLELVVLPERRTERRQPARSRPHDEALRGEADGEQVMRTITIAVLVLVLGIFCFWPHTTGPTEIGVRTVKWSPFTARGVVNEVFAPGAHLLLPGPPERLAHLRHASSRTSR